MASSSSLFLSIALLLLLCNHSSARDFLVGGSSNAWKVPSSSLESLNKWAEANRFQIGDSLVWKMDDEKEDSVVQVTRENYFSCNLTSPIFQGKEGTSSVAVKLDRPGAYYFVSGQRSNCGKGQRVIVVVMSRRSSLMGMRMSPAPSPSDDAESPVIAPTAGAAAAGRGIVAGFVLVVLGIISVFV